MPKLHAPGYPETGLAANQSGALPIDDCALTGLTLGSNEVQSPLPPLLNCWIYELVADGLQNVLSVVCHQKM